MDAKFAILLLACAAACCLAKPKCSDEDFFDCKKLSDWDSNKLSVNEEDMDKYCSSVIRTNECVTDISEKCPNAWFLDDFNEDKKITMRICEKNSSLRRKFIENIECLHKSSDDLPGVCSFVPSGETHDEKCECLRKELDCGVSVAEKYCGKDARDVMKVLQNPEYQLRRAKCS